MKSTDGKVVLCRSRFGKWKNPRTNLCEVVDKFTWKTANRLEVSLMTFGASLINIKAPDRDGTCEDILMGYDHLEDYLKDDKFNFGATIGPVSGVIKTGEFCLKGKYHQVGRNLKNKHCVDGGKQAFSRVNWSPFVDGTDVILSYATNGLNGFPGIILVQVLFSVQSNNTLIIKTTARSNQVTPVDISHRLYFNLASHSAGVDEMLEHLVKFNASKMCYKNSDGFFKKTPTDSIAKDFDLKKLQGNEPIDSLFIIDKDSEVNEVAQFVLRVIHPPTGRVLEVYSNQPTLHFSTCSEIPASKMIEDIRDQTIQEQSSDGDSIANLTLDYLRTKLTEKEIEFFKCRAETDSIKMKARRSASGDNLINECQQIEINGELSNEPIKGKENSIYCKNSGFSIACHNFPNAVNHQRAHPEILLKPGQVYQNLVTLKFGIHVLKKPTKPRVNFPVNDYADENYKFPILDCGNKFC